jgi:hypothetical protein
VTDNVGRGLPKLDDTSDNYLWVKPVPLNGHASGFTLSREVVKKIIYVGVWFP